MQRAYHAENESPTLSMLKVIEKLQDLKIKSISLSNTAKLASSMRNLRTTYLALDDATKININNYMQADHQELLALFQKGGSQLPQISKLAGMITDHLLMELKNILQSALDIQVISEGTHTIVQKKLSEGCLVDTGTFKVITTTTTDQQTAAQHHLNQLALALDSPHLKKMSTSYLSHSTYGSIRSVRKEDSLTVIINAFEILQKTKEIKLKMKDEVTTRFTESYEMTLLREISILRSKLHMKTLHDMALDLTDYPQLKQIHSELSHSQPDLQDVNYQLKIAETILTLLDNVVIAALHKIKFARAQTGSPTLRGH